MRFIIRNQKDHRAFLVWGISKDDCRAKADRKAKQLGWNIDFCRSERVENKDEILDLSKRWNMEK